MDIAKTFRASNGRVQSPRRYQKKCHFRFGLGIFVCLCAPAVVYPSWLNVILFADLSKRQMLEHGMLDAGMSAKAQGQSCRQLEESTKAFTKDVYDDPERVSFPTWVSTDAHFTHPIWMIPKLDMKLLDSAFAGKRVAMVGDSTSFYTLNTLHRILNSTSDQLMENISNTMQLTQGLKVINEETNRLNAGLQISQKHYQRNGAHILWKGFRGSNINENCRFDELIWPKVREQKPQVILANWGLHMMHRGDTPQRLCIVDQFVHYEAWLDTVLSIAKEVGTRLLLFKTTNFICDRKLPDPAQIRLEQMKNGSSTFLVDCLAKLQEWRDESPQFNFTETQLKRYCEEGAMTDSNAQLLNSRMAEFVKQAKQKGLPPNLTVEIFNDYSMERCAYTSKWDGLHYHALQIPRVRMLAHMVNCLDRVNGSHDEQVYQ